VPEAIGGVGMSGTKAVPDLRSANGRSRVDNYCNAIVANRVLRSEAKAAWSERLEADARGA